MKKSKKTLLTLGVAALMLLSVVGVVEGISNYTIKGGWGYNVPTDRLA